MSQWQLQKTEKASAEVQRTYQDTNLHLFAEQGDLAEVKRCIGEGQPVDKRNTRRQTALHCACAGGHRDVVNFLLADDTPPVFMLLPIARGADITAKDDQLVSTLHYAAIGGDEGITSSLISAGAVINARNDRSATPLHCACSRGHMGVIRLLVSGGADTVAVDSRKRSPAEVIGEMGYVKHDFAKAIKGVLNGASGGFREQAADLKRDNETLVMESDEMKKHLNSTQGQLEKAQGEISKLKRTVKAAEEEVLRLRQAAQAVEVTPKKKGRPCLVM